MKSERTGIIFILISAVLWGVFPIIVNAYKKGIPPLFFAGVICLFVAFGGIVWLIAKKKLAELRITKAYTSLLMVSICIIIIPNALFFYGTQFTSGLNSSVLMLSELFFTLVFTPFFGEKNTLQKYIGFLGVFVGGALVLYSGTSLTFNKGDVLILLSTLTFPIGNFYSKRALYVVSSSVVLTVRYAIGGVSLVVFSVVFETSPQSYISIIQDNFLFFLLVGTVLLTFCKISFYEGMKRLDISKSIALEMTYPLFSLLFLYFFFNSTIYWYQVLGICVICVGAYYSVQRKSEQHNDLRYIPKK